MNNFEELQPITNWEVRGYEGLIDTQLHFINSVLQSPNYGDYKLTNKEILKFIDKDLLFAQVDNSGKMMGLHDSDPDALLLLLTDIYFSINKSGWRLGYHQSEVEIASRLLFILLNNPYYLSHREINNLSPTLIDRRDEYNRSFYNFPYLAKNSPEMLMAGFNMMLESLSIYNSKICPIGEHLLEINNHSYQTKLSSMGLVPNCNVETDFVLTNNKYVIFDLLSGRRGLDALRLFRQIRKQKIPGGRASSYNEQSFMKDFHEPLLNILSDSIPNLFEFNCFDNKLNKGFYLAKDILDLFYDGDELDYLSDQEFEELQFRIESEISRIRKFEPANNIEEILSYGMFSFIDIYVTSYSSQKLSEQARSRLQSTISVFLDISYGNINSDEFIECKTLLSEVIDDSRDQQKNAKLLKILTTLQKSKFDSEPQRYFPETN